jgi:putative inorganic carbon (hco3(-)) transporter
MSDFVKKVIHHLYSILFFFAPLVFFTNTSELFEFNKIVFVYLITCLITGSWIIWSITTKRIQIVKTILDIPILLFFVSQLISTIISIDPHTSLFGYYSRFNGGLISTICYSLLYFIYVSANSKQNVIAHLKVLTLTTVFVSLFGIIEHYGKSVTCLSVGIFNSSQSMSISDYWNQSFSTDCWVQDVKSRVFSTFGQPNWLAAWIVSIIPITWLLSITHATDTNGKSKHFNLKNYLWAFSSIIFFVALLFTKSRSGLLGFCIAYGIFWLMYIIWQKSKIFTKIKLPLLFTICYLVFGILIGTPWTTSIESLLTKNETPSDQVTNTEVSIPALESGGTESGEIRKIVWQGAIDIWKNYPLFGSGVETFAFSYYQFRPVEHNNTSEWEYLYNKAHNEYLNYLATTGIIGLSIYVVMIIVTCFAFVKSFNIPGSIYQSPITTKNEKLNNSIDIRNLPLVSVSLFSGYIAILTTNFFGFSVVGTSLLFFIFPAMIHAYESETKDIDRTYLLTIWQKIFIGIVVGAIGYLVYYISSYWKADVLYTQAKNLSQNSEYVAGISKLNEAISISPSEFVYWDLRADIYTDLAITIANTSDSGDAALEYARLALNDSQHAVSLSPHNVNLKRNYATTLIKLSAFNPELLSVAIGVLTDARTLAPTEPKLLYNLALSYLRVGDAEKSIELMKETVLLKPNYKDPHYALALMYIDKGDKVNAKKELQYILENIDPDNVQAKRELDAL